MPLYETYLAVMRKTVPKGAKRHIITRNTNHALSPSWKLLQRIKKGLIDWPEYNQQLLKQFSNDPLAISAILDIIVELADNNDVFLVCYEKRPPCHRFIVKNLILFVEGRLLNADKQADFYVITQKAIQDFAKNLEDEKYV